MELITSPEFNVGVRLGQEVTLARGTGAGNPLRTTGGLNVDAPVKAGDRAVTHSQERGVFPPDIPVGRVSAVDRSSGATVADIEPSSNLDTLDFVVIIFYEAEK
jgi:rod shape-determining protein MreC